MFKDIPENVKTIVSSSAPLVVVLVLFLITGNFGISRLTDIRNQIDQATNEHNTLTQKVGILQTVSSSLENSPDVATNALPMNNSALIAVSQLKNLALANTVVLSGIKSGAEVKDTSGLSRVDISFEVNGTRAQIVAFLKNIGTYAPITVVDSIKLNESAGAAHGTITVKSFWSPAPTTLPAVTASLSELTSDELKVLTSVTSLTQPTFVVLPPAEGDGKTDPFNP